MNINEFKSWEYEQQYEYRSFSPSSINREWTLSDPQILTLLGACPTLTPEPLVRSR